MTSGKPIDVDDEHHTITCGAHGGLACSCGAESRNQIARLKAEVARLREFEAAAIRWYNAGLEGVEATVATNTFFEMLGALEAWRSVGKGEAQKGTALHHASDGSGREPIVDESGSKDK